MLFFCPLGFTREVFASPLFCTVAVMRGVAVPVSVFISKQWEDQVDVCVCGMAAFSPPPHLACVSCLFGQYGRLPIIKEETTTKHGKGDNSKQKQTKRRRSRIRPSTHPSNNKRAKEETRQHTSTRANNIISKKKDPRDGETERERERVIPQVLKGKWVLLLNALPLPVPCFFSFHSLALSVCQDGFLQVGRTARATPPLARGRAVLKVRVKNEVY